MVIWFWVAVTTAALVANSAFKQKTLLVRLVVLVLGLIGVAVTTQRLIRDQTVATENRDYWNDARLNAVGFELVGSKGGGVIANSDIFGIIAPYVHVDIDSASLSGKWDCTSAALDAYNAAIRYDNKFPFTYFYKATCCKAAGARGWHHDIQMAHRILVITTRLPDHNPNHDALLKRIDGGDLGTGN